MRLFVFLTIFTFISHSQNLHRIFAVGDDDTLSVRSGPGTKYRKVAELSPELKGIEVDECRENGPTRWCLIEYKDPSGSRKIRGWANARYLFPDSTAPILYRHETSDAAKKLAYRILETIEKGNPCRLNRYLHPKFGLMIFIIPSGTHPKFHLLHDLCHLESEKVTGGVYQLVASVKGGEKGTVKGKLIFGKRADFDYDLEAWAIEGRAVVGNDCYINTLDGDRAVDFVLLDSVMIETLFLEKRWSKKEYELARKLKRLRRYSYKVVCPKKNLVFFITLIDGKWYLSGFDFASMNFV